MRISGAGMGGGELTGSQKTSIERQIRKLEAKRDEILEKLGAKSSSGNQDSAELSTGNLHINTGGSGESGGEGGEGDASQSSREIGEALRALSQSISSSAPAADMTEGAEDPKELMKQLQVIEMQIMALRQQLNEDSFEAPEFDPEKAAAIAAAGMQSREAAEAAESAAALPAAEVSAEGHVDGYA